MNGEVSRNLIEQTQLEWISDAALRGLAARFFDLPFGLQPMV